MFSSILTALICDRCAIGKWHTLPPTFKCITLFMEWGVDHVKETKQILTNKQSC